MSSVLIISVYSELDPQNNHAFTFHFLAVVSSSNLSSSDIMSIDGTEFIILINHILSEIWLFVLLLMQ